MVVGVGRRRGGTNGGRRGSLWGCGRVVVVVVVACGGDTKVLLVLLLVLLAVAALTVSVAGSGAGGGEDQVSAPASPSRARIWGGAGMLQGGTGGAAARGRKGHANVS